MVDGVWQDNWYETEASKGRFIRKQSQFRNWITSDGDVGPTGKGGFAAERDRYHLYVSLGCPWAHRTLIYRSLKGLEQMIGLSVTNWMFGAEGWTFEPAPGVIADDVNGACHVYEIYRKAEPTYSGHVTVPLLWDKQAKTIVSNESSEIIRMFNSEFDKVGAVPGDFYPIELRSEIDAFNTVIYDRVNNGVYKCGFATTQAAYDEAVLPLFQALDDIEKVLGDRRYLCGDTLTEADWRLFTTLIRFDVAYVGNFKCNIRRLVDYPNIGAYTRELYQHPGIRKTVNFEHIRNCYYGLRAVNPTGIVPAGPLVDFDEAHGRDARPYS